MRLKKLSDITSDYFSVITSEEATLSFFTGIIASQLELFLRLPPSDPRKPFCTLNGSRMSIIRLDDKVIEIESIGCSNDKSNKFLLNTQDTMTYAQLRKFYDHLRRNNNGQPHQRYLF